jgi:protein ImuB
MLWVALHFPQLRLQALSRGHALPEPEREALEAVAAWACRFTPRVSLEPPQGLLLEVAGSLRYYGGTGEFLRKLKAGLAGLGFEAVIALAATARAAAWRAAGGGGALEQLPVQVTGLAPEALELFSGLGVRTVGEVLRLPREGLARRFGDGLLRALDQASGKAPEARRYFAPAESFAARLELPAAVSVAENVLFVVRRLLVALEGFLAARHAGVRRFRLDLLHDDHAPTQIVVGLASPGRGAGHFARLLQERLSRTTLAAPVEAVRLEALDLEPVPGANGDLLGDVLGDAAGGEEWLRLVERLQARLGDQSVHGLQLHADHRPERAFRQVSFAEDRTDEDINPNPAPRPLWLVEPPRRLAEGSFELLAGPERIESGWWDGAEVRRDYFIAQIEEATFAWVFREQRGEWFLHGYFA